jgi:hypothetical protein
MSQEQNRKTLRSFQCRDYLWEIFEQMSTELECSVDYLINEAMRQYARSRNYGARGGVTGEQQRVSAPTPSAVQAPAVAATAPRADPAPSGAAIPSLGATRSPGLPGAPPARPALPNAPPASPTRAAAPPAYPPSPSGYGAPPGYAQPPAAPGYPPAPGYPSAPAYPSAGGYPPAPPVAATRPAVASPGYPAVPSAPPGYGAPPPPPASYPPGPPTHRPPAFAGGGAPPPLPGAPRVPSSSGAVPGAMPTLYVIFNGQKIPITKEEFVIGRGSKSADLAIKDGNISRRHAAIVYQGGSFYMKDLGSTNGVEFQGRRIDSRKIEEGDIFQICDYELRFTYR